MSDRSALQLLLGRVEKSSAKADDPPSQELINLVEENFTFYEKLAAAVQYITDNVDGPSRASGGKAKLSNLDKVKMYIGMGMPPKEAVLKAYPGATDEQVKMYLQKMSGGAPAERQAAPPAGEPRPKGPIGGKKEESEMDEQEKSASSRILQLLVDDRRLPPQPSETPTNTLLATLLKEKMASVQAAEVDSSLSGVTQLLTALHDDSSEEPEDFDEDESDSLSHSSHAQYTTSDTEESSPQDDEEPDNLAATDSSASMRNLLLNAVGNSDDSDGPEDRKHSGQSMIDLLRAGASV
jgi:hypothetical protein